MNTKKITPDQSWLSGKYGNNSIGIKAEINTSLPYVAIDDYFWQGDEAEQVIKEIHKIWINGNMTTEEAIIRYANLYL